MWMCDHVSYKSLKEDWCSNNFWHVTIIVLVQIFKGCKFQDFLLRTIFLLLSQLVLHMCYGYFRIKFLWVTRHHKKTTSFNKYGSFS